MMGYTVPAREARFEQEIKRSRFTGIATRVSSSRAAAEALATLKKEFPDATHHCWAYVLGNPKTSSQMRMDDDGEPTGTAGKPILNVLQHKNVGDILLVVVRYFGGTKLGAGGLVRAYSSSASGVMECLEVVTNTPLREARLRLDYAEEQPVRRLLQELEVTVSSSTYGEHVELSIRFPKDCSHALEDALAERTSGRVKLVAI
jgi:uncharacterized YigZ family protein